MKLDKVLTKKVSVFLSAILVCTCLTACDSSKYNEAEELYSNGDYSTALELYNALGEYKDSQDKVKACQYAIANDLYEKGQNKEALSLYQELGEYEDSKDKANTCQYTIANDLFEKGQYEEALSLYQELGEYEKSTEYAEICEREIGMTVNSDYAFLEALEKSVLNRMKQADSADYSSLVNVELAYLEEFDGAEFYDSRLNELANQYIEGLYEQRDALKEELYCDYQLEWQQGLVHRCEALKYLYEEFNFLSDNKEFVGNYVARYESDKELLDAYIAFQEDVDSQTSAEDFEVDFDFLYKSVTLTFTIKNNTKYTYKALYDFSFTTEDGTMFYTNSAYIENIKPDSSYVVSVYVDLTNCTTSNYHYECNYYPTEVIF